MKKEKNITQIHHQNKTQSLESPRNIHKFHSEYFSLVKKFQIKLMPPKSNKSHSISQEIEAAHKTRISLFRFKTNIQKPKRYNNSTQLSFFKGLSSEGDSMKINFQNKKQLIIPKVRQFRIDRDLSYQKTQPKKIKVNSIDIMIPPIGSNRSQKQALFYINRQTIYKQKSLKNNNQSLQITNIRLIDSSKLLFLANHCKKLLTIHYTLTNKQKNIQQLVHSIKNYIIKQQNCSISKIDSNFKNQTHSQQIKIMIYYQRLTLAAIIASLPHKSIQHINNEANRNLQIILGFWSQVITNTYSQDIFRIQNSNAIKIRQIMEQFSKAQLITKNTFQNLLQTLKQRTPTLYSHSNKLYKDLLNIQKTIKHLSISRIFYQILNKLAIYLNHIQTKHYLNIDNVSFFATCPSPYILTQSSKPYTLVLDLDQTLIYSPDQQTQPLYRPHLQQFLNNMHQRFQLIIFTTSVEQYCKQICKNLKVDYCLFRPHAVRTKRGIVKDISRIGRNLSTTIIIDDLAYNFKYHKQNGIQIKKWTGDMKDNQLLKIQNMLLKIAEQKPKDIRPLLQKYRKTNIQLIPIKQQNQTIPIQVQKKQKQ